MTTLNRILVITDLDGLISIRENWLKLEEVALFKNLFNSYDWVETWTRHYAHYIERLLIFTYWREGELCSILPLYINTSNANTAYYISSFEPSHIETCSEAQDFMSLSVDTLPPVRMFKHHLVAQGINNIKMSNLSPRSLFLSWASDLPGFREVTKERVRFYTPLPTGIGKLDKKTRRYRKAATKIGMKIRKVSHLEELEVVFSALTKLNSERWIAKGQPAIFVEKIFTDFHKDIARKLLMSNKLSLYYLFKQNNIVAVNYSIVSGHSLIFYQSGNNTSFRPNLSPGIILHYAQAIEAQNQGKDIYDFMSSSSASDYKSKLTDTKEDVVSFALYISLLSFFKSRLLETIRTIKRLGVSSVKPSHS